MLERMRMKSKMAGGLRTDFADVVSTPLAGRLAALMRRLQASRRAGCRRTARSGTRRPAFRGVDFYASAYLLCKPRGRIASRDIFTAWPAAQRDGGPWWPPGPGRAGT